MPASLLFGRLRSGGVLYARPLAFLLVAEGAWLVSAETPVPYGLPLILALAASLRVLDVRRPAYVL